MAGHQGTPFGFLAKPALPSLLCNARLLPRTRTRNPALQMTDPKPPRFDQSLINRLRAAFGEDVDPGIALPEDEQVSAAGQRPESSGLVSRLKARVVASTRYRMDGEIGRGGMGAILEVWDEDLRRKLAMKVALGRGEGSSGADELDPRLVARFLEEAQVTGQLEHPGIVPVHELGLDENGQVYFTMRLVRGRDLERVFEQVTIGDEDWSVTRALGVLHKVCEAMAYAHSKGVIHRDLKPANVMVGHFGEVYVMDWGLVRVQGHEDRHDVRVTPDAPISSVRKERDPSDSGSTAGVESEHVEVGRREDASGSNREELYTMDGDVIGTPSYMSPEQARGELTKLDARSDVYAVGAMLYRLLAGVAPFADNKDRSAMTVLSALLKGPPTKLEELSDAPGELIAICEKAMSRAPQDRYADMMALADDLRAFLEHRVVGAYETGAVAEARKWVRRNRPLAASLAAGVVALVAGLVASLVLKAQADESAVLAEDRRVEAVESAQLAEERRVEAEASATLAEERRQDAQASAQLARESATEAAQQARITSEVNEFLNEEVFAAIAPENMGIDVTMRQVLDAASMRLATNVLLEPVVRAELHSTIGTSYDRLGLFTRARDHYQLALALRTKHLGEADLDTLDSTRQVADAMMELGQFDEALATLQAVVPRLTESAGPEHPGTLAARADLASVYNEIGRYDEAREILEQSLEIERSLLGDDHERTLVTGNNLALTYQYLGQYERAGGMLEALVASRKRVSGDDHPQTLTALSNYALNLTKLGRHKEAVALQEDICVWRLEHLGEDHPHTAQALGNLGTGYMELGRLLKAQRTLEQALELSREARDADHPDTLLVANALAIVYARRRKFDESLALRLETLDSQRRVLGPEHSDTLSSMNNLAVSYKEQRRYQEAEALQRETLEIELRVKGRDHPDTLITLENLGGTLFAMERFDESLELTSEVLEARKRVLGEEHQAVAKTTYNLGMIAEATGDTELALEYFEAALILSRKVLGEQHPQVSECLMQLANVASEAKDFEAAREYYRAALAIERALGPDNEEVGYYLHQIGYGHYSQKEYADAVRVLEECVRVRRKVLGDDDGGTLISLYVLAKSHVKLGAYAVAEPLALEFHERQLKIAGPYIEEGRKLLMLLYDGWGKPEKADEWR